MRRRSSRFVPPSLAAPTLALLLAACGAPAATPDPGPYRVTGTYSGSASLLPMAIAYVAFDPAVHPYGVAPEPASGAGGVGAAAAGTEFLPGLWAVGDAFVGADRAVVLTFVGADDVPEQVLVPAADAFVAGLSGSLPAGCTVVASVPGARANAFGAGGPGNLAPFAYGFTDVGPAILVLTTTPVDFTDPSTSAATFVSFVFADRAVTLTHAGTCADAVQDLTIDVALQAGWNRVAMRITGAGMPEARVRVEDDAGTGLVFQRIF